MKTSPLLLVGILLLALSGGCAQRYTMVMSNGARVTSVGKPQLKGGSYVFKDAKGQENSVPSGRVREIAPASDDRPQFMPGSSK